MPTTRTILAVIRIVGKLPHGHAARALLFRIGGAPHGVHTADHVFAILAAARGIV